MTFTPPARAGEIRSLARVSRAIGGTGASAPQPPRGALAETSAIPSPETRPAHLDRAASQVRGRASSPAGDVTAAEGASPAGATAAAGRAAYEEARRKALRQGRRPADPQQAPGRPGAPARVAEMMRLCVTVLPGGGVCGATGYEHAIGTRKGAEVRTRCSIATAAGPCECRAYVPQAETPGGAV